MRTLADVWFDDIRENGLQLGLEQGRKEGIAAGAVEGRAAMLERLITRRFGPLPAEVGARLRAATADELGGCAERLLDAAPVDEQFDPPRRH